MSKRKVTLSGRVDPEIREWIEREAEQRDRTNSYIFEEKLREQKRREQERGETVPA